MTWLTAYCLRKNSLLFALAAIVGIGGGQLFAGEPIVFGGGKTKVEPGKERGPVQSPFKLQELSSPFNFDGMTLPSAPGMSGNSRKDKRQQNAADEKKNWLILEKGELQTRDDEKNFLGIRDDGLEDLDNNKNSRDYTFRDSNSARAPGRLRAPGQPPSRVPGPHGRSDANQAPAARENLDGEPDSKGESRSSAILFGSRDNPAGAHAASELDLKNLLGSKVSDRDLGKSDFSLSSFFNSGESPQSRARQIDRTKEFVTGVLGDPINQYGDLTRQQFNPVAPSSPGDSLSSFAPKSFGGDSFPLRQSIAQPNNQLNFLSSPDANSRAPGFGTTPAAPGMWRSTPVERPAFNF